MSENQTVYNLRAIESQPCITESSKMSMKYPPYRREGLWARPRSPGICLSASSAGNSPRPPPMSGAVVHWQCLAWGHRRRRSGDHRCRRLRQSHQVLHLGRLARSQQLPPLGGLEVRNRISRKWRKVICLKKMKNYYENTVHVVGKSIYYRLGQSCPFRERADSAAVGSSGGKSRSRPRTATPTARPTPAPC